MDFKLVLENLIKKFNENNVRYALIGGLALGVYGVSRATVDVDFLIHLDDVPKMDDIMQELGYECRYRTDNVSQYVSSFEEKQAQSFFEKWNSRYRRIHRFFERI